MITIKLYPYALSPTYNQMMLVMNSTLQTNENFNFLADVYVRGSKISTIKTPVSPDGYGIIDLHRHIENKISYDFYPYNLGFKIATQSLATYSVSLYEQYRYYYNYNSNCNSSVITTAGYLTLVGPISSTQPLFNINDQINIEQINGIYPAYDGTAKITQMTYSNAYDNYYRWLIVTDVIYIDDTIQIPGKISLDNYALTTISSTQSVTKRDAFNGVIDFNEFPYWNYTDYVANVTPDPNVVGKYLTNCPDGYDVQYEDKIFLNVYQKYNDAIGGLYIKTNNGEYWLPNAYKSAGTNDSHRMLQISVGAKQINDSNNLIAVVGSLPAFDDNTTYYTIECQNTASIRTIENRRFNIKKGSCIYEHIQLLFLDKLGSFIPFTFDKVNRENINITKTSYSKNIGRYDSINNIYTYNQWDGSKINLDTNVTKTYTIISDWIEQEVSDYLAELFTSPTVYWIDENDKARAINITTTSFERKQIVNDQMINYTLTFELSTNDSTQRG